MPFFQLYTPNGGARVCRVMWCRWLSYWSDNDSKNSVWFYLGIYAAIGGGNTLFVLIRSILFAYGGLNSAKSLHEKLLHRVPCACNHFLKAL